MRGTLIHATAVALAVDPDGPLAGALLLGPSGSGKSGLAAQAVETCPWRRAALVADDATEVFSRDGVLHARAPAPLAGLVELRGFGPARMRHVAEARIVAAFELAPDGPRLPEPRRFSPVANAAVPVWPFRPDEGSAHRLRLALRAVLCGQFAPGADAATADVRTGRR